ncbi:uncharacterized protein LOC125000986 isoform X2 [Mugil cephalus]|uniref:uncharacterized protein LOC125000986 isoform X2 n=1 Tax=Mugil cephalus TaxID=48193 RepID=UPI001FB5B7A5|nr:uncharacterized protein LOC125000986 isoform X2 [Mugil cephalus]
MMSKPDMLLLLLAVAASQLDLSVSMAVETNISACPITFYGFEFTEMHVSYNNSLAKICFGSSGKECLLFKDQNIDGATVEIKSNTTNNSSSVHQALPAFTSASSCWVEVALHLRTNVHLLVSMYNFGVQTAVQVTATILYNETRVNVTAVVDETLLGSWSFATAEAQNDVFFDVSGCRLSEGPVPASSTVSIKETCSTLECNASAVLTTISSGCPSREVCTVIGSTVVNFYSRVYTITNRCMYILFRHRTFVVSAAFLERHRRDVVFLDHLILWLEKESVRITLEQGGRVMIGDQMLALNSSAQRVHGLEFSKDRSVVTVNIPAASMQILFDGITAHVAGGGVSDTGLCGNASDYHDVITLSAAKDLDLSSPGCETEYRDPVKPMVNCSDITEHCSLMRREPFSACHNHTDPEPFIDACIDTMCKYPDVDGHSCQFLEAYAESCRLQSGVTLTGWMNTTSCPDVPEDFCQDTYCSPHEFCGEKLYGDTRCFCRAIFASKYQPTNALGEPTVCFQNSATLTLAGCLLEDKGIDYKVLHLNDDTCSGLMDNRTHMVTFSFDRVNTCGTEVMMNGSQVIYHNTVTLRNNSLNSIITRHDQVQIDFSCFYSKPQDKTVGFRIKDSSVIMQIVSGVWNYTLMMNAYTDPGHSQLITSSSEVLLNQKIWVELKTQGLDDKTVSMVIDSCWSTEQPSPEGNPKYDLIMRGCPNPADKTVRMENNGMGTSNYFSFNMFQFSGKSNDVYLHCKLNLCLKQGASCAPVCGAGRRRRSLMPVYADTNPALITMVWTN